MITEQQIEDTVQTIVNTIHPQKMILFGSYAEGNPSEDSDLDLLIIQDTNISRSKRGREVRKFLRRIKIPLDILVYTTQEIEEWQDVKEAFITQIMAKGKVVYG